MVSEAQIRIIPKQQREALSNPRTKWCADYLVFDALSIDAGTVNEADGIITAKFHFTNAGKDAHYFSRLDSSCSCVSANISSKLVKKGESATITVSYDPSGHPGFHPRYIYLYEPSDESEEKLSAVLILNAMVLQTPES